MKLQGNEDLRVRKTITGIRYAFEDMICEMGYSKMTVRELCDRALINKKTFYRYYPTMDDLLMEYQAEMSEEYIRLTRDMRVPEDCAKIVRTFCLYSAEQGEAYQRITCSPECERIREQMIGRVLSGRRESALLDRAGIGERAMYLAFVRNISLVVYRQWIADGRPTSPERMADVCCELACRGSEGFIGRFCRG